MKMCTLAARKASSLERLLSSLFLNSRVISETSVVLVASGGGRRVEE